MQVLNLISVIGWLYILGQSIMTVRALKDQGLSRNEITAITILLLSLLNITRGTIATMVSVPTGHLLLEHVYIGTSVFQILLCNIVLKYINSNNKVGK